MSLSDLENFGQTKTYFTFWKSDSSPNSFPMEASLYLLYSKKLLATKNFKIDIHLRAQ